MTLFSRKTLLPAICLLGAAFGLPAHAGFSWTIDSYPAQGSCGANAVGNSCQRTASDAGTSITMTATGWASSAANISSDLEAATLNRWDGIAVQAVGETYASAPQHAADNSGKLESILYSFTSGGSAIDVIIDSVTQGWHQDADFSLLAYTGGGAAPDFTGLGYDDLTSNGWQLVSNNFYAEGANGSSTDITASDDVSTNDYKYLGLNAGNVSSSYWLVAVLNRAFYTGSDGYFGNDFIKIKTLTASASTPTVTQGGSVPEPSTAALLLAAMGGLVLARRRKYQKILVQHWV